MRLLSNDDDFGFIGIGQSAVGVIAIGQFARGIIAIGQVAIGVVAVGQGVVSIVGVGQGGIGVAWFAGMLGLGGRGICVRLIPGLDLPRDAPRAVSIEQIAFAPPNTEGFVKLEVLEGARHPRFAASGRPVAIKPSATVSWALANARAKGFAREVYAHLHNTGAGLVCDRVMEIPGTRRTYGLGFQALRVATLCAVGAAWWFAMTVKMSP